MDPNFSLPPVNILWQDTDTDFHFEKQFGQYCALSKLGQGAYGMVKTGEDTINHIQVAIKLINKIVLPETEQETIKTEAEVMSYLSHENIVSLYSVFENRRSICMVMEYAGGGELFDYILRQTKIGEVEARKLFVQLLSGIGYAHSRHIIHRDIKAENIFLDEKLETIKIGDWGFATMHKLGVSAGNPCGTLNYAAPEILTQDPQLGPEVDVWALGAVLYFMVCGWLPFRGATDFEVFSKIKKGEYRSLPSHISEELKSLIGLIFNVDRKTRPTIEHLKTHVWCARAHADPEHLKRPKLPRSLQYQIRHYRSKSDSLSPRINEEEEKLPESVSSPEIEKIPKLSPSTSKSENHRRKRRDGDRNRKDRKGKESDRKISERSGSERKKKKSNDSTDKVSSDKRHRKQRRRKPKGEEEKPSSRKYQIEEEEEYEDHIEAEDLSHVVHDFSEIGNEDKSILVSPPKIDMTVPPAIGATTGTRPFVPMVHHLLVVPKGGSKEAQMSPDESHPTGSSNDVAVDPPRHGRRPSHGEHLLPPSQLKIVTSLPTFTHSYSPIGRKDKIKSSMQRRSLEAQFAARNKAMRSSFRKSTFSMLRVTEQGLEQLRVSREFEVLSVEPAEGNQHVVFVSAHVDSKQETLELLKPYEALRPNRLNRSKTTSSNRRSIFMADPSKIFTEGAREEEIVPEDQSIRRARAVTCNVVDLAKFEQTPSRSPDPTNDDTLPADSVDSDSGKVKKRDRGARGAGSWGTLNVNSIIKSEPEQQTGTGWLQADKSENNNNKNSRKIRVTSHTGSTMQMGSLRTKKDSLAEDVTHENPEDTEVNNQNKLYQ